MKKRKSTEQQTTTGKRERDALDLHALLMAKYSAASPLKSDAAKEVLADALATQVVHQKFLREGEARGDLCAEESRTLPAVASSIKRLCEALHISVGVKEDNTPI